jgi:hypothetical protein
MPVKSADTMLGESISWEDMPAPYLDEFLDMQFLTTDPAASLFPNFEGVDSANVDFTDFITQPSSPKYHHQIHHDCMWSGTCVDKSHPSKKRGMMMAQAQAQMQMQQQQQQQSDTNNKSTLESTNNVAVKVVTQKSIMTPNVMKTIMSKSSSSSISSSISNSKLASSQRSLLISSSRINTNTAALTQKIQNTSRCIESSSRQSAEFDSMMNASIAHLRPDTPLSLGDDVPEFKHNIDLTPCPSSNRMKFNDPNSIKIINALAEHLEETSNSLNDPINPFIGSFRHNKSTPTDLNEILTDITFLSDYEDLADDSSIIDMDDDDQLEEHDYKSKLFTNNLMSQASTSSTASTRTTINHHEFISDHSYTRPKGSRYDLTELGVQTPSDSGELLHLLFYHYR